MGDVSNDVNERTLDEAFNKYPSYCKSKVVRDRLSEKVSSRRNKLGIVADVIGQIRFHRVQRSGRFPQSLERK